VDSVDAKTCPQKTPDIEGLCYSPDGLTTDLDLSIHLSMCEFGETRAGDCDIFLGPHERVRTETGGAADQWVLKQRESSWFAIVNRKKRPHPWDTHYQF